MEISLDLQKPNSDNTPHKLTGMGSNEDFNNVIEEIASSRKEKEAKEEREKRIREIVQKQFVRIGDKYFKLVHQPDKTGRTHRKYVERLKTTIQDDFGKNSTKWVKKYEGFCLVPSHINFQPEINGFFNEYYQLSHEPDEGSWATIMQILRHIFGDHITFIIDYLHLLYTRPTQWLPILLLESKAKNTGKSTFGTLLKLIFEENAIKLGNSDFESDFNALWIKSLCIIVDETSLDKKGIMQMIKRLSTETNKVTSNEKNRAQTQIDFIGKFIFMSNDESKALPIERGDPRFAVFKVPTFQEKGIKEDPNIDQKIISEIPALLNYLKNMTPHHKEQGRMYFAPEVYCTNQLPSYYENNQSYTAKAIQEFIREAFEAFPDQPCLHYSTNDLIHELHRCHYLKNPDRQQIKKALENELSILQGPRQRYDLYSVFDYETISQTDYNPKHCNTRVYKFGRADFTNP